MFALFLIKSAVDCGNARFTMIPFKALFDHVWIIYERLKLKKKLFLLQEKNIGIIRNERFQT